MKPKTTVFVVAIALCLLAMPAVGAVYDRYSEGYIVYTPTIAQADRIIEEQLPSGLVPEHEGSGVALAEDIAGKMLVLAAAYRHTDDQKYLDAYNRMKEAVSKINETYGYIPRYFWLDGTALTVWDDMGAVEDAIVLASLLMGQPLPSNVSAETTVSIVCETSNETTTETSNETGETIITCPYDYGTSEGTEEGTSETSIVYSDNGTEKNLKVRFTLPIDALKKDTIEPGDIIVEKVWVIRGEDEISATPDDCILKGIKKKIAPDAKEDLLIAISRELLSNPDVQRGFSATTVSDVLDSPLKQAVYQAKEIILGNVAVPWDIVRYSKSSRAEDYVQLTETYSLIMGAMFLPSLAQDDATWDYEITTSKDISYKEYSDNLRVNGSNIVYTKQDLTPKAEKIWIRWRPVAERRVHVSGSFTTLLEKKFGVNLSVSEPVVVSELPSGEYEVKVHRQKVFDYEDLEGEVRVLKPNGRYNTIIVQYPTLDVIEAQRAYREAIEEENPEKLFVAVDNLMIHRFGARVADLDSGAAGVLKAMYSLSNQDIERVARDDYKLKRTLYKWKEYYASKSVSTAEKLVRASLKQDSYNPDIEKLLYRLYVEAESIGLGSASKLRDLYTGYVEYFGPHTKNYTNLVLMAQHLPEYQAIIDAIESGDYDKAEELVSKLPDGQVKQIFLDQIDQERNRGSELREEALAAVKRAIDGEGDIKEALNRLKEYERIYGEDDEISLIYSVLNAYDKGLISVDSAKAALSELPYYNDWAMVTSEREENPPKPSETERPTTTTETTTSTPTKEHESGVSKRMQVVALVLLSGLIAAGAVLYKQKKRGGEPPARMR